MTTNGFTGEHGTFTLRSCWRSTGKEWVSEEQSWESTVVWLLSAFLLCRSKQVWLISIGNGALRSDTKNVCNFCWSVSRDKFKMFRLISLYLWVFANEFRDDVIIFITLVSKSEWIGNETSYSPIHVPITGNSPIARDSPITSDSPITNLVLRQRSIYFLAWEWE